MPRRREAPKREVPLDPLQRARDQVHQHADARRQGTAEQIYASLATIQEKTGDDPLKVFKKAVENVKPALEVEVAPRWRSNYQVPVEVNPNRRLSLSIRWLVGYAASAVTAATMKEKLANELMDAANLRGGAVYSAKTCIAWPRPTKRSRTTAGTGNAEGNTASSHAQHRHHGAHRCRQDHYDRTDPAHGHHLQDW